MASSISPSRLVGALACVAIGALGAVAPGLVLAGSVVAMPAAVIADEHMRGGRRLAAAGSSLL